jgi:hypothetical protein
MGGVKMAISTFETLPVRPSLPPPGAHLGSLAPFSQDGTLGRVMSLLRPCALRPASCPQSTVLRIPRQSFPWTGWQTSVEYAHQSGVAGETRTDCGLGDAHGSGIAGVCGDPTASPAPALRARAATTRQHRADCHAHGSRGVCPLYASDARALYSGRYSGPPSPRSPRLSSAHL